MKSKNLLIILISSLFAVIVVVSVFLMFTVKDVKANFNVSEESENSSSIQKTLDGFIGANLIFLNVDDVKNAVEKNPYIEVLSVEKQFPNVIELSVRERREIFILTCNSKDYVTNEKGFVLKELSQDEANALRLSRLHIPLELGDIEITSANVGEYIDSPDMDRLNCAFSLAEDADLTDCIDYMRVTKRESTTSLVAGVKQTVVSFYTYTGVEIVIWDAGTKGEEKLAEAFKAYDGESSDYIKSHSKIEAFIGVDDKVNITWTK